MPSETSTLLIFLSADPFLIAANQRACVGMTPPLVHPHSYFPRTQYSGLEQTPQGLTLTLLLCQGPGVPVIEVALTTSPLMSTLLPSASQFPQKKE